MKITEDVRKYAAEQQISEDEALAKGMADKSARVRRKKLRALRKSVSLS